MKKQLLFLLLLFANYQLIASHAIGGEITAQNIGGNDYVITAKYYRDPWGIPASGALGISITDPNNTTTQITLPSTGFELLGNQMEEHTYSAMYTFSLNGMHKLYFEACCRAVDLSNLVNSANYSLYIDTEVWVDSTNSTPVFLNSPITHSQLNVPFIYNPLPYDEDGDSLVWELDQPYDMGGVVIPGYILPYGDSSYPFTLNTLNGECSFLPNAQSYFTLCYRVKEYRNGIQIGYIRREMTILSIPSSNITSLITTNSLNFPYSGKNYTIAAGSNLDITVTYVDQDGDMFDLEAIGEPFIISNSPATYSVSNVNFTSKSININWNTVPAHARINPYFFCVRNADSSGTDIFKADLTFVIYITNVTAVDQLINNKLLRSVYPNPSQGSFTVELNSPMSQKVQLQLMNIIGEQISIFNTDLNSGLNLINIQNKNLQSGKYLMNVIKDGGISESIPLIIE